MTGNKADNMTWSENTAYHYLINDIGLSESDIEFRKNMTPDFLTYGVKDSGYEIKLIHNGCISFTKGQFNRLKNMKNVILLVFDHGNEKPILAFSATDLKRLKKNDCDSISVNELIYMFRTYM